jgi:hypothetical protein
LGHFFLRTFFDDDEDDDDDDNVFAIEEAQTAPSGVKGSR